MHAVRRPTLRSSGAVGLDRAGRPLYVSYGGPVANSPYDIDITLNAPHAVDLPGVNSPFGVGELERILRFPDRDAPSLPQRLANLTTVGNSSVLLPRRAEVTTESWWVPVASAVLPPALRNALPSHRSVHPVDLLEARIRLGGGNAANLNALRFQLLPWETLEGLKMDINRPFGAGAYSMGWGQGRLTLGGPIIIPDQPGAYPRARAAMGQQQRHRCRAGQLHGRRGGLFPGESPVGDRFAGGPPVVCPASLRPRPGAGRLDCPSGRLEEDEFRRYGRRRDADDCPVGRERGCLSRPQRRHDRLPLRPEPVQRQRLEPAQYSAIHRLGLQAARSC